MVAVPAMRMVEMAVDEVVLVVAVGNRFVPAARAVLVAVVVGAARVFGGAVSRVGFVDREPMLIVVAIVRMVQMAVVEIVGVPVVANRGVAAALAVLMPVVVVRLVAHESLP